MEKKTIAKLVVAAVIAAAALVFACGVGTKGNLTYQIPGPYAAEATNDYSTVRVEMTVEGDRITDCGITSSGDSDLLNDDIRAQWAQSIVDNQSYENDVISGATLKYSAASVKEASADIFGQAGLPLPEPAVEPEPEPTEAPAEEPADGAGAEGLADGTYAVQKTTDFSTIDVGITVENGVVTDASVASAPLEGQVDMLTDDIRNAWAGQIVEKQAVDAVSGVTVSSMAVQEAVEQLLAGGGSADAGAAGLTDGTYAAEATNDFSTVNVEATVEGGKITAATVTSSGDNDLLTDELRAQWAQSIVDNQSADNDVISGATLTFSAASVKEATDDILAQAAGGEAADAGDEKVAELEAALADAEARAAEAEAKAAEAEAKVAELEAAAAAAATVEAQGEPEAESGDISAYTRPRPVKDGGAEAAEPAGPEAESGDISAYTRPRPATEVGAEAAESEPEAEVESGDISAYTRPRPATEVGAEAAEPEAEAESGDISAYTRPRPATDGAAEAAEPAGPEAESGDISAYTRPRPVTDGAAEAAEPEAEAESGDISAYTRPRPATEVGAEAAEPEAESGNISAYTRPRPATEVGAEAAEPEAEELSEEARLASILPNIVTTMGDNRENSYVVDYLEQDPYLVNIYEGYGFAKDYGSARGHEYTLEDVAKTQRPHPKANCITCKTPDLHKMIEEQGVAVYSMPFDEVFPQMTNNVSCYTCHGDDMGNGGRLAVTHQYVNEALGDNVRTIQPATLSCGQCHIEYYFTPEDSETMMPYHSVEEMTPQAILDYYDGLGFSDWTQESTGTPMLKAQHPEMETFLQGKHAAFLTCADCHMAPETTADGVEYRSHMLVSPLENEALLASCAQCHGDTDMTAFVHDLQDRVTARETEVGNALSAMKDALAGAVASGEWSEENLNAVRKLHREAQWFFDYCYVENSEGAHNSELSLSCLDTAQQKIDQAMALLNREKT